jgi:hypothetical protein
VNFPIEIPGFENQELEVRYGRLLMGMPKFFQNGDQVPRGRKRTEVVLRRDDGHEVTGKLKNRAGGFDLPVLEIQGDTIEFTEALPVHAIIWNLLPLVLIFLGGALGAVAGIIAAGINNSIFHSKGSTAATYFLTGLVSAGAVIVYLTAVILIFGA